METCSPQTPWKPPPGHSVVDLGALTYCASGEADAQLRRELCAHGWAVVRLPEALVSAVKRAHSSLTHFFALEPGAKARLRVGPHLGFQGTQGVRQSLTLPTGSELDGRAGAPLWALSRHLDEMLLRLTASLARTGAWGEEAQRNESAWASKHCHRMPLLTALSTGLLVHNARPSHDLHEAHGEGPPKPQPVVVAPWTVEDVPHVVVSAKETREQQDGEEVLPQFALLDAVVYTDPEGKRRRPASKWEKKHKKKKKTKAKAKESEVDVHTIVSEHYDPGLLSLSVLSTAPGLQLRSRGTGEWVGAPHGLEGGLGVVWAGHAAFEVTGGQGTPSASCCAPAPPGVMPVGLHRVVGDPGQQQQQEEEEEEEEGPRNMMSMMMRNSAQPHDEAAARERIEGARVAVWSELCTREQVLYQGKGMFGSRMSSQWARQGTVIEVPNVGSSSSEVVRVRAGGLSNALRLVQSLHGLPFAKVMRVPVRDAQGHVVDVTSALDSLGPMKPDAPL